MSSVNQIFNLLSIVKDQKEVVRPALRTWLLTNLQDNKTLTERALWWGISEKTLAVSIERLQELEIIRVEKGGKITQLSPPITRGGARIRDSLQINNPSARLPDELVQVALTAHSLSDISTILIYQLRMMERNACRISKRVMAETMNVCLKTMQRAAKRLRHVYERVFDPNLKMPGRSVRQSNYLASRKHGALYAWKGALKSNFCSISDFLMILGRGGVPSKQSLIPFVDRKMVRRCDTPAYRANCRPSRLQMGQYGEAPRDDRGAARPESRLRWVPLWNIPIPSTGNQSIYQ